MRTRFALAAAAAATLALPAVASAADRNDDGIPDKWETAHHLRLVDGQDAGDQDRDGLSNLVEWQVGTDPRRRDSDRDGKPDGREDADHDKLVNAFEEPTGHDPDDADTDGDGVKDGKDGAGRVVSLRRGVLTLDLGNGRRVRGLVGDDTAPACGTSDDWLLDDGSGDDDSEDSLADVPAEDLVDDVGDAVGAAPRMAGDDSSADDDPGADDSASDDGADDAGDDSADDEGDDCASDLLEAGTWLHGSSLAGGRGSLFELVEIVTEG